MLGANERAWKTLVIYIWPMRSALTIISFTLTAIFFKNMIRMSCHGNSPVPRWTAYQVHQDCLYHQKWGKLTENWWLDSFLHDLYWTTVSRNRLCMWNNLKLLVIVGAAGHWSWWADFHLFVFLTAYPTLGCHVQLYSIAMFHLIVIMSVKRRTTISC